jgi:hypothetical protein
MTMFHKSWTWKCITNNVGTCMTWGWNDPILRLCYIVLCLHNVYAMSLNLRLKHVLKIWIDLLRVSQPLLRNRVVIKVAFGFVRKHVVRHAESRRNLPLYLRGISLALEWSDEEMHGCARLRVNPFWRIQIIVSRKRGQLGTRPNIVRQWE